MMMEVNILKEEQNVTGKSGFWPEGVLAMENTSRMEGAEREKEYAEKTR